MKTTIKRKAYVLIATGLLCAALPATVFAASQKQADTSDYIGIEAAKKVAVKHAGTSSDKATFTKAELDYDDGVAEYDIEFYADSTEYDYEINAASGKVSSYSKETGKQTQAENKSTEDTAKGYVGTDKAKEIALKHAGVSAKQATFIKAELDYDDGMAEYDIEFYADSTEYDYEINAASGKVSSYSKEKGKQAEATETAGKNTENTSKNYIGTDKAKEIALEHAGVSEKQATFIKAELDYDDGVGEYDIEFYVGGTEYEYEINAASGKILDYDAEIDD